MRTDFSSRVPFLVAVVLLAVLSPAVSAQAPLGVPADVDVVFQEWESNTTPGCAVAASRGGAPVLARAYGMADLEHGVANTPETIYEAGSVSKQFTAAAIVLLALEGALSLDDDVRRYVPELPDYGRTITIRHLLNHTSGLRDWGSVAGISGWGRSNRSHNHDHVLDILSRQTALNYPPGEQYSYTNSGYNLMAVIVDRVSGQSFADFSRDRIFEPLGLTSTQWRDDYRRIVSGRASAYARRGGEFVIDRPIEHVHGNGGLLTTVGDLLRWDRALATGEGLGGEEFVRLMHEQGVLNDGTTITYASGIRVSERHGVPEVSHTGSTAGYRAFLGRYPDQDLAVALLCNVGAVSPGALGGQVVDMFLAGEVEIPVRPAASRPASTRPDPYRVPADQLAAYAGTYNSPDAETTFRVMIEDAELVVHRRPDARFTLTPVERDVFRGGPGSFTFHRDEAGRVVEFGLSLGRVFDMRFYRTED